MRAVVQDRYGDSDAWRLTDTDVPTIEPHEVPVRVPVSYTHLTLPTINPV